jgi:SAM-dependent methyltransferase
MLESLRRRQTLASFDYQWGEMPDGDAMLSDPWFRENVDRILTDELLCVEGSWFRGRQVLDAGCGIGRWTLGFLRLGATVTAVDFSPRALERLERNMRLLAPEAVAEGRLSTARVDLLELPAALSTRRFDLVYSFGVLHHTGDAARALANLAALVEPEGLLFLYLYGRRSQTAATRLVLAALRAGLAPFPFGAKQSILKAILPARDPHQAFDTFSPLVNDTFTHEQVEGWLRALGFAEITRTIDYTELYLRARRNPASSHPFRPLARRPYWFERYRRRALPLAYKSPGA